jgi:hypothetical protein
VDRDLIIVTGLLLAAFSGIIALAVAESEEWEKFSTAHNCHKVAHISGSVMPTFGISSSGQVVSGTTIESDKTGFLCDNGITYYR